MSVFGSPNDYATRFGVSYSVSLTGNYGTEHLSGPNLLGTSFGGEPPADYADYDVFYYSYSVQFVTWRMTCTTVKLAQFEAFERSDGYTYVFTKDLSPPPPPPPPDPGTPPPLPSPNPPYGENWSTTGYRCNCPDFTKKQSALVCSPFGVIVASKFESEQVDRDWSASDAGTDHECKHILSTRLYRDENVPASNDPPL